MSKICDHTFLTQHSGTEQSERLKKSLLPENFNLNDFSITDWMEFAFKFANKVNYFSTKDPNSVAGNWEAFFIEKESITTFLASIEESKKVTPHLTLFIAFLKLLEFTKERFNSLNQRHLDFYYKEILQIQKKEAVEDQVHLLFQLAKNTVEALVTSNTLVEAGKDAIGKRRQYATDQDIVVNQTSIGALKSVYHHRKKNNLNPSEKNGLFVAPVVNSLDGKGKGFKEDSSWLPFGYPSYFNSENVLDTPDIGFAVAAPTLQLSEGRRLVQFSFSLKKSISGIVLSPLLNCIDIYATGEKGWIGPFKASTFIQTGYASSVFGKKVQFAIEIDKSEEAIVAYHEEIHTSHYSTPSPLFKFIIKTQSPEHEMGYEFFTQLIKKELRNIEIDVFVEGAKNLTLKNDTGNIAADKPFHPFGTQPVKRSAFYIHHEEAFQKKWDEVSINATWLNTPDNFKDHYIAYRKDDGNSNLSPLLYYQTLYHNYNPTTKKYTETGGSSPIKNVTNSASNLYVTGDDYFTAKVSINNEEVLEDINASYDLFTKSGDFYKTNLIVSNNNYTTGENGPIKFSLNQSFLHSLFPKIYALALSNEEDTMLPNEPYTPQIETIELNYKASQKLVISGNGSTTENLDEIELFHIHPFGNTENNDTLVPEYCQGGNLYIGLVAAKPLQNVSLLFQLLEGTENPLAESFTTQEKIEWAFLCDNAWKTLDSRNLIGNTTDNFLKTGIVTVQIPEEANSDNTLLPSGYTWLRAKTDKSFDAICKCIDIHTQVTTASFINNGNDVSHLEKGLEKGTISKLTARLAQIKKIEQPYHSFGGQPEESDPAFYKRVSERIRHRDRAINLWDYEHLILEKFKSIYKVKCLNHTKEDNFHAPGHVSLVVIPDIVNNNAFDIYQPRVSTAQRNEIQAYINNLNSFFIQAEVINPDYEEIEITTEVKFNKGYDENFYTSQLETDIKKYLSPWAFEETNDITFGASFHRSKIINYLEQLPYVDFLNDFDVKHRISPTAPYKKKVNVVPSNPKAILVSAKKHFITPVASKCKTPVTKKNTPCLS